MRGRRKETKNCVECGEVISGYKDYCIPCHIGILKKIRNSKKMTRTRRAVTPFGLGSS